MKKKLVLLLSMILLFYLSAFPQVKGYLFIIGGGSPSESMMKRFIELASRFKSGKIIIFPMASAEPDKVAKEQAEELKKLGAQDVSYQILTRGEALSEESAKILDNVGGVFFSGGVQSRLTDILLNTPLHRKLLEIYKRGAAIGGTSAGAAVMSELMITGDERRKVEEGHEFETIQARNIVTSPGLGFIKEAIIDQHFVMRKRHNRLISLVVEYPKLLGIGIDESTAIIVNHDKTFEVIGEGNVIVLDASRAKVQIMPSQSLSGSNIIMHILKAGDQFNLKTKKALKK
jgi:cyanophycinase